jgi:hypothetical protein
MYWQIFKENCDPLIKVLHIPTTEPLIFQAMMDLKGVSPGLESLLFAIYYSAVASLAVGECLQIFGADRDMLLRNYQSSLEHALARARLLETEETIVLQAFVVFLTSLRTQCNVRLTWTLTALAVRLAQNAGLHRDGSHFSLPPFVVEMRRRLWWSLCVLDSRAAEDTGYDAAIPHNGVDAQMPLNVNDADLTPDMTELPKPRQGMTDMTFAVIRFQATKTFRKLQYVAVAASDKRGHVPSIMEKSRWIVDCQSNTYETCLKGLDLSDPFSWYNVAVSRIVFTKMWLLAHHSCLRGEHCTGIRQDTKERLFADSIGAVENWLLLLTEPSTSKWRWLCETYVQWYALTFILSELCMRTHGDLVERAWRAVEWAFHVGLKSHIPGMPKSGPSDSDDCDAYKPLKKLHQKARAARAEYLATLGIEAGPRIDATLELTPFGPSGNTPFVSEKVNPFGPMSLVDFPGSLSSEVSIQQQQHLQQQQQNLNFEWSSLADTMGPYYDDDERLNWSEWDTFPDGICTGRV